MKKPTIEDIEKALKEGSYMPYEILPSGEIVLKKGIELKIQVEKTWGQGVTKGSLRFTFADCSATVTDGEKEIGSVIGCLGGGVQFTLRSEEKDKIGEQYYVSSFELWRAFCVAIGKEDLIVEAKE